MAPLYLGIRCDGRCERRTRKQGWHHGAPCTEERALEER